MIPFIVNTTCSSKKEAKKIADILLKNGLAACVQLTKIDSFYIWKEKRCEDKEYLLTIKTKKENYKQIKRKIKENHSYDLPEIIGIK
ncbi:MAG: divalent-cation tolerance protein CutA, partial [Campylobacterota bacterium]|nr:divalent-cation tolerance protein CutA [Campylobacterota bacterium]